MPYNNTTTSCNTDTNFIKLIALFFMIVDHIGIIFFPNHLELRMLGRIAMPLFAWSLVMGACYTKNIWIYIMRIVLLAIVSQPIYNLALNHSWDNLNILFTFSLALIGIAGIQQRKYLSHILLPVLSLFTSHLISVDYGTDGVLFIILLYLARSSKLSVASFFIAFSLYWGKSSFALDRIFCINIDYRNIIIQFIAPMLKIQSLSILALPIILINTHTKIKINRWVIYCSYPLHLLIIYLIKQIVK